MAQEDSRCGAGAATTVTSFFEDAVLFAERERIGGGGVELSKPTITSTQS